MELVSKDIPLFKGKYIINSDGSVYSKYISKYRKLGEHTGGYSTVALQLPLNSTEKRRKYKNCFVHRLVAEAFIPNPQGKCCVNHIDGDKKNNNVNNLEWVTHSENMQHASRTGLINTDTKLSYEKRLELLLVYINTDISLASLMAQNSVCGNLSGWLKAAAKEEGLLEEFLLVRLKKNLNYTPVCQYTISGEYITTFHTIKEAAKSVGGHTPNIINAINKDATSKGFRWKYKATSK